MNQIRSKYENLKTKARKHTLNIKHDFKGTGGGRQKAHEADAVLDSV